MDRPIQQTRRLRQLPLSLTDAPPHLFRGRESIEGFVKFRTTLTYCYWKIAAPTDRGIMLRRCPKRPDLPVISVPLSRDICKLRKDCGAAE